MPCQWYVIGGGVGKLRILIGQSVPPTPFGMAFGRLKLSPLDTVCSILYRCSNNLTGIREQYTGQVALSVQYFLTQFYIQMLKRRKNRPLR
jgi:hypothetical protein